MPKSDKNKPPKRLGRGLEALIGDARPAPEKRGAPVVQTEDAGDGLSHIALDKIQPNRWQPRQHFDEEAIRSLAQSIRESGLMQPLVVRRAKKDGFYELISGERRLRAATMVKLKTAPALVRSVADQEMAALALVENLQREDLNIMEQANALQKLIKEFGITHEKAAVYIGQTRSAVSNMLRLLDLSSNVKEMLQKGELQMGHGRALLGLPKSKQLPIATKAVRDELSVRAVEELVRQSLSPTTSTSARTAKTQDAAVSDLERELADHLGTTVSIQQGASAKGKIVVRYTDYEQLEGVLERIGLKR